MRWNLVSVLAIGLHGLRSGGSLSFDITIVNSSLSGKRTAYPRLDLENRMGGDRQDC